MQNSSDYSATTPAESSAVKLWLGLLVALLVVALLGCSSVNASQRPNILLLVAEDLSPRIGAYDDSVAQTPNLDALAQRSVRYSQVFTTAGVCAPSRAALIMGQHQISFAAQHMRTTTGPLGEYRAFPAASAKAFPEYLRQQGYYTFTDTKLDYQFSGVRAGSGPFTIWDAQGAAADWQGRGAGQPFFGLINFMQTHESGVMVTTGEPHSASHKGSIAMRRAMGLVAPKVTTAQEVELPPYYPDLPAVRSDLARHYDNIAAMDTQVGHILQRLEQQGLLSNTIIIWTTDHGDGLPRAKRELFDSGIKVPLLLARPQPSGANWRAGEVDSRLVSFVDIAPTILALAGVTLTADQADALHGESMLSSQRQFIYASRDRIDEVVDRQRAVRSAHFKYIESYYPQVPGGHQLTYRDNLAMVRAMRAAYNAGELTAVQSRWFEPAGAKQLYDLRTDPFEITNLLVGEPNAEIQRVANRLSQQLSERLERIGDTGAEPETQLRDRLLKDGQVPTTAPPILKLSNNQLIAQTAQGASVGYRVAGAEGWQLYTKPLRVHRQNSAQQFEFKAVRYGWRESPAVRFSR